MKLTILQENLAKAVSQSSRFVNVRSQLPILGNILLKATKTKLSVSSTNLEVSILTEIGAKIEEEGEITVPSKVISELVNNLPKETVTLESDKEQLKVAITGFNSKILGMNASDFPKIPSALSKPISLPKKDISKSLSQVIFATSTDETRPVLTGVLIIINKDNITLVATDGFRLSRKKIKIDVQKELSETIKVVVPKSVLSEYSRSLEEVEETKFEIQEKEKQIIFGLENIVLSSRILEGDYPDFEKIIPKDCLIKAFVDKEDFLRAIKLASIFAREAANIVKLKFFKDSIKVLAESSASGSQETKIDAKVDGIDNSKEFEIAFNYRFLEEFVHSVVGDEIKMEFTTVDKAGVFTDSSDPDYLHLIMPVKV